MGRTTCVLIYYKINEFFFSLNRAEGQKFQSPHQTEITTLIRFHCFDFSAMPRSIHFNVFFVFILISILVNSRSSLTATSGLMSQIFIITIVFRRKRRFVAVALPFSIFNAF